MSDLFVCRNYLYQSREDVFFLSCVGLRFRKDMHVRVHCARSWMRVHDFLPGELGQEPLLVGVPEKGPSSFMLGWSPDVGNRETWTLKGLRPKFCLG
jgi:hypothetical protein